MRLTAGCAERSGLQLRDACFRVPLQPPGRGGISAGASQALDNKVSCVVSGEVSRLLPGAVFAGFPPFIGLNFEKYIAVAKIEDLECQKRGRQQ
jgi:hypothetical protein